MATAPSDPGPVLGRVHRDGRLVAADRELEQLQREAGSQLGDSLALPQLATVARLAQRLGIPVSRRVLAAGKDMDVDMWVRAVPDGDEIELRITRWAARPAAPPRLAAIASVAHETLAPTPFSWSMDDQLRLVSVSAPLAELLGLDPAAAAGSALTRLFRLDEDESGEMPLLAAIASRKGFSGQRVTLRSSNRALVLSGEAMMGPGGAFTGFEGSAAFADDPGETVDGQPMVDGTIHSALRSPLDNIVRSAEEMIDRSASPGREDYSVYAADIAAAARHLLSVIRSLGEHAESPERQRVDLHGLAFEAIALIESAAQAREIVVAVQPVESFPARGEPRRVIQVLVNLIGNAVRHSAAGTAVTISFETAGGSALVHVADEGPGIDPADHERIFEPFERANGGSEGSGLGLSIARRLARAMGGDIRLESTPGNGSRFTLALPAA